MARIPLYQKAETEMLRRIKSGKWQSGMRLGNEFELAEEFGVSQGTMRRALMTLEAQGYLSRKPGRGTIVSEPAAKVPQAANHMPRRSGSLIGPVGAVADFAVHRAKVSTSAPTDQDRDLFGDGEVHVLERMWKRSGMRAALEEVRVPASVLSELQEVGPTDLEAYLGIHGIKVARLEDRITTRVTTMSESVSLACERYTALMVVLRTAKDAAGKTVAMQRVCIADPDVTFLVV